MKNKYVWIVVGVVVAFFAHTLVRPFVDFDENIIFNELIYPVPQSINELFAYIKHFGFVVYFEASNPFYSSLFNMRSDPFNGLLTMIIQTLFQKNASLYHLFSLFLHICNCIILFKIIQRFSNSHDKVVPILLTLCFALHPLNVEAVIFATNWGALLSYLLGFISFYIISFKSADLKNQILAGALLFLGLLNNEQLIMFPFIALAYSFYWKDELKKSRPLFISLALFMLYFFLSKTHSNFAPQDLTTTLERIFWLAPQIFMHNIQLILFPLSLTIDQSAMVKIASSILNPYAITCVLYFALFVGLFFLQRTWRAIFLPFFLALLPFLHIISPLYNLSSERYFYVPLFFLAIGISIWASKIKSTDLVIPLVASCLIVLAARAYIRTYDWRDSEALFKSALSLAPNDLYKGLRLEVLGALCGNKDPKTPYCLTYINKGIRHLENVLNKVSVTNVPKVIKYYGLDDETKKSRAAYVLSFVLEGQKGVKDPFIYLTPYMKTITDSQILQRYLTHIVPKYKNDEVEELCSRIVKIKQTPPVLIGLSVVQQRKYKDNKKAEAYLLQGLKYFKYDTVLIQETIRFYGEIGDVKNANKYLELYKLRIHAK